MKLDRGEVGRLLGFAHKGFDSDITHVTCGDLAALCRLALEVMDAPVASVSAEPDFYALQAVDGDSFVAIGRLDGVRVRLVRVQEG